MATTPKITQRTVSKMTNMIYYDIFDYKEIKTCEEVKKQKREDGEAE